MEITDTEFVCLQKELIDGISPYAQTPGFTKNDYIDTGLLLVRANEKHVLRTISKQQDPGIAIGITIAAGLEESRRSRMALANVFENRSYQLSNFYDRTQDSRYNDASREMHAVAQRIIKSRTREC